MVKNQENTRKEEIGVTPSQDCGDKLWLKSVVMKLIDALPGVPYTNMV